MSSPMFISISIFISTSTSTSTSTSRERKRERERERERETCWKSSDSCLAMLDIFVTEDMAIDCRRYDDVTYGGMMM